jgi:hypothetical protein
MAWPPVVFTPVVTSTAKRRPGSSGRFGMSVSPVTGSPVAGCPVSATTNVNEPAARRSTPGPASSAPPRAAATASVTS